MGEGFSIDETPEKAPEKKPSKAPKSPKRKPQNDTRTLMYIIAGLVVVILALGIWFFVTNSNQRQAIEEALALKEQAELDASQREL